MRRRAALGVLICLEAVLCGACGGGGVPTTPTAVLTGLRLSGAPDLMVSGEGATLVAEGAWSDGAARPMALQWTSDAPSVISIDGGTVTARATGTATISVTSGTASASARIRVVPALSGTWSGSVRYPTCTVPARWGAGFCPQTGISYSATLDLVQQRDTVIGTLDAGRRGTVRGTIAIDGTLQLSGQLVSAGSTRTLRFDIRDWSTSLDADGSMRGRWAEVITWDGEAGQGLIDVEVIRLSKR